jgi:hypothetical protein
LTAFLCGCARQAHPSITLSNNSPATLTIRNLDRQTLDAFPTLSPDQRNSLLQVHVADTPEGSPPLSGDLALRGRELVFTPRYPFQPGLKYRASFTPHQSHITFTLPSPKQTPTARVTSIYPSSNQLPENLLKFYIHFSSPMSRGEAYDRIKLLDENNHPIPSPFLQLAEELWNPDMTRFTLFFEPGRIKQGLVPRAEMGTPLVAGRTYTLVIDNHWRDSDNRPLVESARKTFRTLPADHRQPDAKRWVITPPPAGSREPLTILFDEPLDHAMLQRVISVADTAHQRATGAIQIDNEERRWSFTPTSPWRPGPHKLLVEPTLEDLCGNSLARPFEVDLNRPPTSVAPPIVEIPFDVK